MIHHGIEAAKFLEPKAESKRLAAEWGKQEDNLLIGAIGRLHQVKGFQYFIEACALLYKQAPARFRFVLIGEGPERAHLEASG